MAAGDKIYLIIVLVTFVSFVVSLGYASWWSGHGHPQR
jgi:hypothetical protein